jgi:hypothetical protein
VWDEYADLVNRYYVHINSVRYQGVKSKWKIAITQLFGPGKYDPYMYLDKYLSEKQIENVLALKHRSREQVNKIIEYIDDMGVCDEILKCEIYRLFKVSP